MCMYCLGPKVPHSEKTWLSSPQVSGCLWIHQNCSLTFKSHQALERFQMSLRSRFLKEAWMRAFSAALLTFLVGCLLCVMWQEEGSSHPMCIVSLVCCCHCFTSLREKFQLSWNSVYWVFFEDLNIIF